MTLNLITLYLVVVLVVAHFIADFVAQSDWMAINKAKNWTALAVHAAVYSLIVTALVGVSGILDGLALWGAVNFVAHFIQDAITSRITSRLWFVRGVAYHYDELTGSEGEAYVDFAPTRHWFFVMIGLDQCLHYLTLFVTASWWL